jgi:hypothetical protein
MKTSPIKPRKAINPAFLKVKPTRNEIELFKTNLVQLLDRTNETESEEFHKNLVIDFLKKTYYGERYFINTKGRTDLVIHTESKAKSSVGVIVETKKPTNQSEMITAEKLNRKAFHELVLYYLRERITLKNLEVKHLIITNTNEWFIFEVITFDRIFAQNKNFVKQFQNFEAGRLADVKTDFFYKQIVEPFIAEQVSEIEFIHFDIRDYQKILRNADKTDDRKLIGLFKLLSPEHLLKLPFTNDSNSLDKRFYAELLHIMGLAETKDKSKKIIDRNAKDERNAGSLLENIITKVDSMDKLSRLPNNAAQFGKTADERLFNVGLELCITWINRILFLKLLEAQLVAYHKGDKAYAFLNSEKIKDYDKLDELFLQVLARKPADRSEDIQKTFGRVPYLNSSLFELTEMEHKVIQISNLDNEKIIPILSTTVLKDVRGKKRKGDLTTHEYLFAFLDAYDFSSEGSENIQEENKTLINASVLGLIFEKINGYKDGSFFTPGFITMYMCRETIRKAVIQKFNEANNLACTSIIEIGNRLNSQEEHQSVNDLINTLKICDPAVGSGHFLVSALNEIIAIKSELEVLMDKDGRRIKHDIAVVNDELIIRDRDGELFEYSPKDSESQRVQETLFHEKQTIIENCLFGVDINPNSVKICRLRLWIELLKNAYYKNETELETLPNIDINIKCGNSLVSRFGLDADLKQALRKSKYTIDGYRVAVDTYRNAQSKEEKWEMESLINDIESDFRTEISRNDKKVRKLERFQAEYNLLVAPNIFGSSSAGITSRSNQKKAKLREAKLSKDIEKLSIEIQEIKENKIYENAFEWRFEFPEVLNNDGDFLGFDVVIGNPPYIRQEAIKEYKPYFKSQFNMYSGTADVYIFFIEKGFEILKEKGVFTFIMPNKFMQAGYGKPARQFLLKQNLIEIVDFGDFQVFEEATTYPCILIANKTEPQADFKTSKIENKDYVIDFPEYVKQISNTLNHSSLNDETWVISTSQDQDLLLKVNAAGKKLENYIAEMGKYGIKTGLTEAFVIDESDANHLLNSKPKYAAHIHPFLLGRDVKPYVSGNPSKHLIKFPKGFTKESTDGNYEEWFLKEFPEIHQYFEEFKSKAIKRTDKGDFYWELRACDYYDKFKKPKIMYQVMQVKPCFIYDEEGLYCNNSIWFIPTDDKVLLGILNSSMGWWLISKYCTAIQNGFQLIWKYFSQIPIATKNNETRTQVESKVNEILSLKKQDPAADTAVLETEIDALVYELYGLTAEEIRIVEGV